MIKGRRLLYWTALAFLIPCVTLAQTVFHADVNLISVNVRVTDPTHREVRGLGISDFTLLEDGHPQKIALFVPEEQPFTLGILLDTSSSMGGEKIERAKAALKTLIASGSGSNEVFYMEFSGKPGNLVTLAGNNPSLPSMISKAGVQRAGTALYDAIAVALCRLQTARNPRKALLVITDGADQFSRIRIDELIRIVQSSRAQVFMVGYFSANESSIFSGGEKTVTLVSGEAIDNPFVVFDRLARESGSECFFPDTAGGLRRAIDAIANNLRTQYTIGYYAGSSPKAWRRIEVKVNRHGMRVEARRGFLLEDTASALFNGGCTISRPYSYERKLTRNNGRLIYHEDFTDPASGWPENSTRPDTSNLNLGYRNEGYVHRGYVKDGYELLRQAPDGSASLATIAAYGPSWTDFRATLRLRPNLTPLTQLGSPPASGLVFRMNDHGFYAFLISSSTGSRDVYYKLVRRDFREMRPLDLIGWTHAPSFGVPPANAWKQIAVECRGDTLSLFIGGHPVQTVRDSHMEDGLVGMALYGADRAVFHDLLVEELR